MIIFQQVGHQHWKHLVREHITLWISIWKQKGIRITEKSVTDKIKAYHASCGESFKQGSSSTYQKYLRKTFVDAILVWIVMDNQVS